ncbi:GNAT family N-acetyltransferase [Myxacorys almedinensis]|nr:GNAT family N-acetyltransferase [Myxacorys almedinensis]
MPVKTVFRAATLADCSTLAQLFQTASDGVSDYIWKTLSSQYPGLTPLEIGAKRYANAESLFSYKNCVIAECRGNPVGMMLTFPAAGIEDLMASETPEVPPSTSSVDSPEADVLAPYSLEAPGTWYICALAVFPEFRGQGIGTELLSIAHQQAAERGLSDLSLLCFEQNTDALRLYQRHGFEIVDRAKVVPHPLIHYTGDILLMTAPVQA